MKILNRVLLALLITLALDRLTKLGAEQALLRRVPVSVIGQYVQLTLDYNTGVSFGMFANGGVWLLALTSLIIAGLVVWLLIALHTRQLLSAAAWPAGMILGGAIANFGDRLVDGRVTDFLDFGISTVRWPTFNFADSFIMVGIGLLMVISLFQKGAAQIPYEQNDPNA